MKKEEFSSAYVAAMIEKLSTKEDFVEFLNREGDEYISFSKIETLILLYKNADEMMADEGICALFAEKYFSLKSYMMLELHGVLETWYLPLIMNSLNFKALVASHLYEDYVKDGHYLREIFECGGNDDFSEAEISYLAIKKGRGKDFRMDEVFYLHQKDFLLNINEIDVFLQKSDYQPLIDNGNIDDLIKSGFEGACNALCTTGHYSRIKEFFDESVLATGLQDEVLSSLKDRLGVTVLTGKYDRQYEVIEKADAGMLLLRPVAFRTVARCVGEIESSGGKIKEMI